MRRTGKIRVLLGVFVVILVAVLFFSIKEKSRSVEYVVGRADPTATIETADIKVIHADKEEISEIKAERFFEYSDGRPSKMINVSAVIVGKNNDPNERISIEADEMKIYDKSNRERPEQIEWSGSVKTVVGGKIILADKFIYTPNEKKYIFTGTPVKVIESCRETTAEEVIVNKPDNTIVFRGKNRRTFSTFKENCESNNQKGVPTASFSILLFFWKDLFFCL